MKYLRVIAFGAAIVLCALAPPLSAGGTTAALPVIAVNNNRVPAGQLTGQVLHLSLEARWGRWYPEGPKNAAVPIQAFAESGKSPQIPGPLIRIPVGTVAILRVRNAIAGTRLTVHGLMDRPTQQDRPFDVAFGQTREIRFHATAPGTYYYWGSTTGKPVDRRYGADSQLNGAIVVDPQNPAQRTSDRIFVIGMWENVLTARGHHDLDYGLAVINGRTWPYTERLSYAVGTTVRWRIINTSYEAHPMHLHGFYFRIDARGDGVADASYRGADRDVRVTELIEPGHTFAMTWRATRAGSWLFHCHLPYHTAQPLPLADMIGGKVKMTDEVYENTYLPHAGMGGLILAVAVTSKDGVTAQPAPARHVHLLVEPAPDNAPDAPSFRYVLEDDGQTIAEPGAVGPPLVLTRGVPVAIDVTNHLAEPTTVHWHGMELQDSYFDGVADYSGAGDRRAPMIAPGETFEARMTPVRAGTFIYHTHMDDIYQLRGGLAGPLIVLNPGEHFNAATDHIYTMTTTHSMADALKVLINGVFQPDPLVVTAGVKQRLRFINMTTFWTNEMISLSSGNRVLQWQPLAVDGADLPTARRALEAAVDTVTIGQTRDYTFTPSRGDFLLQIWPDPSQPPVAIPVHAV